MAFYRFGDQVISSEQVGFENLLENFYANQDNERPVCICKEPGSPMYIARAGGRYIIKRMPNTGGQHTLECESYEPPEDLSGEADVSGSAIQHLPDGSVNLKFDFSLTKTSGRAPTGNQTEASSVKRDTRRLTLRGYLDCLWAEAELNKWRPGMAGKRGWRVIHRELSSAVHRQVTKGISLSDIVYVPEPWDLDHKDAIEARLVARMRQFMPAPKTPRKLMIVAGELKEMWETMNGWMLVLKHVPNHPFLIDKEMFARAQKAFKWAFELASAHTKKTDGHENPHRENADARKNGHLFLIATVGVSSVPIASVEEISFQFFDENWLPMYDQYEKMLADKLVGERRSFVKFLRYNRERSKPMAAFHLLDATEPFNIYIDKSDSEDYQKELQLLLNSEESADRYSVWRTATGVIPPLPPKRNPSPANTQSKGPYRKSRSIVDARKQDRHSDDYQPVEEQPLDFVN